LINVNNYSRRPAIKIAASLVEKFLKIETLRDIWKNTIQKVLLTRCRLFLHLYKKGGLSGEMSVQSILIMTICMKYTNKLGFQEM
jgi:hypothetical protein